MFSIAFGIKASKGYKNLNKDEYITKSLTLFLKILCFEL